MSYLLAALGFAVLIVAHEFGHFAVAKAVGMRVERFALFFPPMIWKVRRGETEYGVGAIPLGGYVRITGMDPREELPPDIAPRAYYAQPAWKRIAVIAAGPAVNIVLAFGIIWALFVFQGQAVTTSKVDSVEASGAAASILKPGDRLISVDGVTGGADAFREQIATHTCGDGVKVTGCNAATPATLVVERAGQRRTLKVTPTYDGTYDRMRVGFAFGLEREKSGPIAAVGDSVSGMWAVSKATVSAIVKVVYDSQARKEVSGVVGSYETTRATITQSTFADTLSILAVISLSLAIVNLFPFLPLDGGHIFWALAEKVRGKAISFSVLERASLVGFVLVFMLFAIGLTNDIDRLRGAGFGLN